MHSTVTPQNDTAITNLSLELIGRVWPTLEVLTLDMTCAWDSQALNAVLCRFHEIRVFSAIAAAVDDSALSRLALYNDKLEAVRVSHCCQVTLDGESVFCMLPACAGVLRAAEYCALQQTLSSLPHPPLCPRHPGAGHRPGLPPLDSN